jgi:SulP family sulfate permease
VSATAGRTGERRLGAEVGIGLVLGFMLVAFMVSFASLLFAGEQARFLGTGVTLVLLGAVVHNLVNARWGTIPGAIVVPQDATTAVVAAGLLTLLPAVDPAQRVGTILVYTLVCTAGAGLVMLVLGAFRLGGLVRFIPLPVIGGFLAGTGWLLVAGGADLATAGYSFDPIHIVSLLAAAMFGVGQLLVLRFRPSVAVVPLMVGAGVIVFFGLLAATGTSLDEARSLGLLPATGDFSNDLQLEEALNADWSALGAGVGGLISVPLVATMALLLNVTALDIMRGDDADLDQELRMVGFANLATSLIGIPAGYHALGPTSLAFRLGVVSRTVPLVVAGVGLVAALAGSYLVGLVPTPVVAGLLIFLGLGFLTDWLIDRRRRMTGPEFVVMSTIVAIVATLGLVAAVAWGLLAAVVLFVVAYSRLDPVRTVVTGRERRSAVDRSAAAASHLDEEGGAILAVELQGYLFFGSSHALIHRIEAMMAESGPIQVLILDLHRVQGADSTALSSLAKLAPLAGDTSCRLILSDVPDGLRAGLASALADRDWIEGPDIDHALEMGEDLLLERIDTPQPTCREMFGPELWARIEAHLERVEVEAGEVIIEHGANEVGLVAVDAGEIVTEIPAGESWRRVRRSGAGTVVGEMSLYRPGGRTARVRTTQPTVLYRLDRGGVAELERTDPETAADLHRFLARVMAERLAIGNEVIRSLLD